MEKSGFKNSRNKDGRKQIVSGENLVAVVPPVRVLNTVGAHMPVAVPVIPVHVHRAKSFYAPCHQCHRP